MGELGAVTRYLYWSDRRVRSTFDDNGVKFAGDGQAKVTSPDLRGVLPKIEVTRNSAPLTKADLARKVELAVGQLAVSDFVTPGPVRYAKGTSPLIFGEFVNHLEPERALFYTDVTCPGGKVAVCLFGSLDNFADFVGDAGALHKRGWTSSAAPEIEHFIATRKLPDGGPQLIRDQQELAEEALKVATSQGMTQSDPDTYLAWRRGFTFGDTSGRAEWFAEIYVDRPIEDDWLVEETGCTRVLVGAPLWVRTPSRQDVRLFGEHTWEDLEAAGPMVAEVQRPTWGARFWRRLLGRA